MSADQPKSRKVAGYVKAMLKMRALSNQYETAKQEVLRRQAALTGGQMAEAQRQLGTAS